MGNDKYTSDLFVSYASEDFESSVSDIFMALFETGITSSWIDRLVIKPGDSIPNKIDEGITSSRYLLPIVSETYFKKEWTRAELDAIKMLSKPTIPIWIDVTPKQVQKFSPTLGAQKAIIYDSNPYQIAEEVGNVLISNKRTHYYKERAKREESKIFWSACYFYILTIIEGKEVSECPLFTGIYAEPDSQGNTMQQNVEEAIAISDVEILHKAAFFRKKSEGLEAEITNEDIAHIICGEAKRKQPWFLHEPREHTALKKLGYDQF